MRDLLERWAKVEPERCRPSPTGDPAPGPHLFTAGTWWSSGQFPEVAPALILAAVIEAIEARTWLWQMGQLPTKDYWARVWDLGPDGGHVDRMNCADGDPFLVHEQTPAAALLSAYLNAIEASR